MNFSWLKCEKASRINAAGNPALWQVKGDIFILHKPITSGSLGMKIGIHFEDVAWFPWESKPSFPQECREHCQVTH
jgi:hypothetical protein